MAMRAAGRQLRSFLRHQASSSRRCVPNPSSGSFAGSCESGVNCSKLPFLPIKPSLSRHNLHWYACYVLVGYNFPGMGCYSESSCEGYCTSSKEGSGSDILLDQSGVSSGGGDAGSKPTTNATLSAISKRHDLIMMFTCKVCDTRSAKTMSRDTYDNGIVIVRCPQCRNLHLIADRLGWFGEPGSVEDFLAQQGVDVRKGSEETYEFSAEDFTGWTPKENE
ncbi:unnamed protein product [Sphagnum troendelagicum]|uniref:DNL-type domain-containing protein n=1 Tax=Sphagnum troendelagicum TaxID=128251 RepID=A0ABP0TQP0_9BRYO